jgi:hypothetical protein
MASSKKKPVRKKTSATPPTEAELKIVVVGLLGVVDFIRASRDAIREDRRGELVVVDEWSFARFDFLPVGGAIAGRPLRVHLLGQEGGPFLDAPEDKKFQLYDDAHLIVALAEEADDERMALTEQVRTDLALMAKRVQFLQCMLVSPAPARDPDRLPTGAFEISVPWRVQPLEVLKRAVKTILDRPQ